jgi:8-oxo-dGTP diphosphatase
MERLTSIVAVHALFEVGGRILLGLRTNTGWSDGLWHLPAGHLEPDESATDALCREAAEEVGVVVDPADLTLVHVMHQGDRIQLFFRAARWSGTIVNNEPLKCGEIGWFAADALPVETVDYTSAALRHIKNDVLYSEYGQLKSAARS